VGSSGVVSSEHVDSKNAKPKTNDERVSSNWCRNTRSSGVDVNNETPECK
jgi:hypothetical protein